MSTKTTFKRIALVAAASLGLGLISAIPAAQATVVGLSVSTPTAGSGYLSLSDSTTASTFSVDALSQNVGDTVTIALELTGDPGSGSTANLRLYMRDTVGANGTTTTAGYSSIVGTATTGSVSSGTYNGTATTVYKLTRGDSVTAGGPKLILYRTDSAIAQSAIDTQSSTRIGALFSVYLDTTTGTAKAGTYSFTVRATPFSGGVAGTAVTANGTVVITAAADASLVASAANSTAVLRQAATFTGASASDSIVALAATASNTAGAVVRVTLKNASGTANTYMESVTATIDKGLVGDASGTYGRSVTMAYNEGTAYKDLFIRADGTAGQATLNISSTSVTFAAKTITFFATTVSTLTATQRATDIALGANASAITVVAKDANGNTVGTDTAIYVFSASTSVVSETATACTYDSANARHNCTLTGVTTGSAAITVGTASKSVASDALTVNVRAANPAKAVIAFDKASYAPGEKGYIIVSATDSAGNPVAGAVSNLLASGGITTTSSLTSAGSGISTSDSMTTGVISPTLKWTTSTVGYASKTPIYLIPFFAPQTSGTITLSATGGSILPTANQVALTASAKVANAAQDSADAALAAVTALSTQVSAFITKVNAQITTLTDLVMKIQKKVKA